MLFSFRLLPRQTARRDTAPTPSRRLRNAVTHSQIFAGPLHAFIGFSTDRNKKSREMMMVEGLALLRRLKINPPPDRATVWLRRVCPCTRKDRRVPDILPNTARAQ